MPFEISWGGLAEACGQLRGELVPDLAALIAEQPPVVIDAGRRRATTPWAPLGHFAPHGLRVDISRDARQVCRLAAMRNGVQQPTCSRPNRSEAVGRFPRAERPRSCQTWRLRERLANPGRPVCARRRSLLSFTSGLFRTRQHSSLVASPPLTTYRYRLATQTMLAAVYLRISRPRRRTLRFRKDGHTRNGLRCGLYKARPPINRCRP